MSHHRFRFGFTGDQKPASRDVTFQGAATKLAPFQCQTWVRILEGEQGGSVDRGYPCVVRMSAPPSGCSNDFSFNTPLCCCITRLQAPLSSRNTPQPIEKPQHVGPAT